MKEPEVKKGGRPRKRDRAVVEISEAMGIKLSADALSVQDLEGFPQLAGESKRNQGIMAMVAMGFPQRHIADAFNISQPTVNEIIKRIDPGGMFKSSPKAKKAFMSRMCEGTAMSAVNSIGWGDILELDADKRANVASKLMKISADLNATKHSNLSGSRLDSLLQAIEVESVEEGEFEVNEKD